MANDDKTTVSPTILLPLAEAASRLGLHPSALRSRIRRGAVTAKRGNDKRLMVEVPANTEPRHDVATISPDDELAAEIDYLRDALMVARERAVGAEERAAAVRELADRLTAELAEARRPWWRKLFG